MTAPVPFGLAVSARYDRRTARIVVNLNTGRPDRFPDALGGSGPRRLRHRHRRPAAVNRFGIIRLEIVGLNGCPADRAIAA